MPEQRPQSPGSPTLGERWKRTIGGAAAALLLLIGGAVVNVAVAWGCALWVGRSLGPNIPEPARFIPVRSHPSWDEAGTQQFVMISKRPGWTRVLTIDPQRFGQQEDAVWFDMFAISYSLYIPAYLDSKFTAQVPPWSRLPSGENRPATLLADGFGWPMLSLSSRVCASATDVVSADVHSIGPLVVLATPPRTGTSADWSSPRVLPLHPVAIGFIINTLFYALLLWLLFFAPFAARRLLRRRRGLCEKCAYPIGVSPVCTECGAAVSRYEPRA